MNLVVFKLQPKKAPVCLAKLSLKGIPKTTATRGQVLNQKPIREEGTYLTSGV